MTLRKKRVHKERNKEEIVTDETKKENSEKQRENRKSVKEKVQGEK